MGEKRFTKEVTRKQKLKLRAKEFSEKGLWYGLGMLGMVGWAIAIPVAAGGLIGLWLDKNYPMPGSWAISLIAAGLFIGCFNAWRWIKNEQRKIDSKREEGK